MILFFDTETTARDPKEARLVQLALVLYTPEGRRAAVYSALVRPDGFAITQDMFIAQQGISDEYARAAGIGLQAALSVLAYFTGRADLVVCHNVGYDRVVIEREAERAGRGPFFGELFGDKPWYCTMKESTPLCKLPARYPKPSDPYKWPNLQELHAFLFQGAQFDDAHDALADVEATARCYFEMQKHLVK